MKPLSLAGPRSYLQRHRLAAQLLALSIAVVVAAAWTVANVSGRKQVLRAEESRVDRAAATLGKWATAFQPASSDEQERWRQAAFEVERLGSRRDERLALAAQIASQVERPGFMNVRVTFELADTASVLPPSRAAGSRTFALAPYRLAVSFRGNLSAARAFIENLPAAVVITGLQFRREGADLQGAVTLGIYEPADGK